MNVKAYISFCIKYKIIKSAMVTFYSSDLLLVTEVKKSLLAL